MSEIRVHQFPISDLNWGYRTVHPYFETVPLLKETYKRRVEVDPAPCYCHRAEKVTQEAKAISNKVPLPYPLTYYILPCEDIRRTNAYADRYKKWLDNDTVETKEGWVFLSAKRIPPHPAMTKYLVAHEYGHHVQWAFERKLGIKDSDTTDLDKEYMELRPGTHNEDGIGKWHSNIGELFANDFRILVLDVETGYWPHDGFEHPFELPHIRKFWEDKMQWYLE